MPGLVRGLGEHAADRSGADDGDLVGHEAELT
jgi:hypothetical protein